MDTANSLKPSALTVPATSVATAAASGSLPILNLVAISHADTALTKMSLSSDSIASRAFRVKLDAPASHQRRACVSSNSRTSAALPKFQLFFRQRFEKFRPDSDLALPAAEFALGFGRDRHDLGNRLLAARENDLLARLGACDQLGEVRLRSVNRVRRHEEDLANLVS